MGSNQLEGMNLSNSCDLAILCQTCNALEAPWECCYWDEKHGSKDRFQSRDFHVTHNKLRSEAWKASFAKMQGELRGVISELRIKSPTSLPSRFIPEVKLANRDRKNSLDVIQRVKLPIIAVSLSEFFDGTRKLRRLYRAESLGLNRYLEYDGQVLLTTDVPDTLCEYFLKRPGELRRTVERLGPSFVTTPDTSCYHNLPATISLYNIDRAIIATAQLADTQALVIGLALGSNSIQLLDHVGVLREIGCNIIALPLYEFRRSGQYGLARHRVQLLRSVPGTPILALSCTPWRGKRLILANYYSSWSWFPPARGEKFNLDETVQRLNRLVRRCQAAATQEVFA
jgi:hypothetical protein